MFVRTAVQRKEELDLAARGSLKQRGLCSSDRATNPSRAFEKLEAEQWAAPKRNL